MAIPLLSFPLELQLKILNALDRSSLARICRANKAISARAVPILWHDIDLNSEPGDQRKFLLTYDKLIEENPERWNDLAANVRFLRLEKVLGIFVPYEQNDEYDYTSWRQGYLGAKTSKRTIYDAISSLERLNELALFVKEPFDMDYSDKKLAGQMHFPKLRKLQIGGCISETMALALLSMPETIEELSCIALQDGPASQDQEPGGLLILSSVQERFTNLKILHLCKLAELSEDHEEVMGLRWPFSRDNDYAILNEWAEFLPHVSETLVDLTLEDRYLVTRGKMGHERTIDPTGSEDGDPQDWGGPSSERFREIMLPAIADQEWPNLQKLTLIGLDVRDKKVKDVDRLEHLQPRIQIEHQLGGIMLFQDDATPITISPPSGLFGSD